MEEVVISDVIKQGEWVLPSNVSVEAIDQHNM